MAAINESHSELELAPALAPVCIPERPGAAVPELAAGGQGELALATRLYYALACGHERLAYNIAGSFPLWRRGASGRMERMPHVERVPPDEWRPCLEVLDDGSTTPRRFNPFMLMGHIRGQYDLAPNAPSWCGWKAFDIDTHVEHELLHDDSGEIIPSAALERAIADRDRRFAELYRAFALGPRRLPVVVQTPGMGLHVYLPLMRLRGEGDEHTWPAEQIVTRTVAVLHQHSVKLADGRLELYPAGRPLRAPCGRGTILLDITDPEHPDNLGLRPAPGTTRTRATIARGERYERTVRRPWEMVAAFLARWETARRPLDEWLGDGRPWCPVRGPFTDPDHVPDEGADEKNRGAGPSGGDCSAQHIEEGQGLSGALARVPMGQGGRRSEAALALDPSLRSGSNPRSSKSPSSTSSRSSSPVSATEAITSRLLRGPAFRAHLGQLLRLGVVEAGTRHDAVLKVVFWWHVSGQTEGKVRALLEDWARAHPHVSRRKGERLVRECLREGMHYYRQIRELPQRARAFARTVTRMRALAPADFLVLAQVREDVRDIAHAILEYLAGHADRDGRVRTNVTLGRAQLNALVVRDRRIVENGVRHRAEVIAVAELVRLGVLTLAVDYSTGRDGQGGHGRIWSCWYQFGTGMLATPREPGSYERSRARKKAPAEALVVAERQVRDGTVRVLSAGVREAPYVELEPRPGVVVEDKGGGRWWRDMFERRRFTVGEFYDADEAVMLAGPWSRAGAAVPPPPRRYGALEEDLPAYPAPAACVGSYDPASAIALVADAPPAVAASPARDGSTPVAPPPASDGRAALAAELAVDVEQIGDLDPELAALAAQALQTIARRR